MGNIKTISVLLTLLMLSCSILFGCEKAVNTTTDKGVDKAAVSMSAEGLNGEGINKDNIMSIVRELASRKYSGRMAGTIENSMSSKYIAEYFKKIGLESPVGLDNYMQNYQQPLVELTSVPTLQILDKTGKVETDFNYTEDFVLRRLSSDTDDIHIEAPMYLVKDSSEITVENDKLKGKVLLIPWEFYSMIGHPNAPIDYAKTCGALGVISEFNLEKSSPKINYLKVTPLTGAWMLSDSYKPFVFVDSGTFSKLTEASKKGMKVQFNCSSQTSISDLTANVIGVIPGSDAKLKDEHIIIGAHFDHVGDNMNGTYNSGSLDNASGVAAMMELARVLRDSKIQPRKSIVFVAFNGEEGGFWGSSYYCEEPIYPLNKAVMINLDMIGSAAKLPLSVSVGTNRSDTRLRDVFVEYADKLSIPNEKTIEPGSDHISFEQCDVPSVLLCNMDFESGYHSPHETMEAVDGEKIKEIVKLVLYYIKDNAY